MKCALEHHPGQPERRDKWIASLGNSVESFLSGQTAGSRLIDQFGSKVVFELTVVLGSTVVLELVVPMLGATTRS